MNTVYPVESFIDMAEVVKNTNPHYLADAKYYPAYVIMGITRTPVAALFTIEQIQTAVARANKNKEDIPPMAAPELSWWEKLLTWIGRRDV